MRIHSPRKGQAALEFIITYGWAILVVIAAIGALTYFGVLNPMRWIPDKCDFQAGLTCTEGKADAATASVYFSLYNNFGEDISSAVVSLSMEECQEQSIVIDGVSANDRFVSNTGGQYLVFTNCALPENGIAKGRVSIEYIISGQSTSHNATGEIRFAVEGKTPPTPPPVVCGDGICGIGENCASCSEDCSCTSGICCMGLCKASCGGGRPGGGQKERPE